MNISIGGKEYEIIEEPHKHVVVPTKKELHGWWPGKRECTSERMLINPYNGCGIGCFFCYSLAFPGHFQTFRKENVIIVAKDFDKIVSDQLDSINVASCGYLSPVTDPFQPVNNRYHLSEKIIRVFVERNIPIEFITKAEIPEEAIELIKEQKHSFGQISFLSIDENLRKILVPRGASNDVLFRNLERMAEKGIYAVCRIDPIFPYLTDNKSGFQQLIKRAKDSGAKHIIVSVLDIPIKIHKEVLNEMKTNFGTGIEFDYRRLYVENIDGYLNARIDYRKKVFDILRNICENLDMTFALCMEYELIDGKPRGLNREFTSSRNCEGIDIPVYRRVKEKFVPATDCRGDCLNCTEAKCGIEDLVMKRESSKKDWRLKDYRRWSRQLKAVYPL
jgi:DNA repair photolyase